MYPANFATLAVPNVFGSLQSTQDYWGPNYDTLPEVGATDKSFNYLFIGAAPTIVLVWFGMVGGLLMRVAGNIAGIAVTKVLGADTGPVNLFGHARPKLRGPLIRRSCWRRAKDRRGDLTAQRSILYVADRGPLAGRLAAT